MNQGIEAANGEYIGIVETDDYIEKDMYRKLYQTAVEAGFPDIVKCSYNTYRIDWEGHPIFTRREILKPHDFTCSGLVFMEWDLQKIVY